GGNSGQGLRWLSKIRAEFKFDDVYSCGPERWAFSRLLLFQCDIDPRAVHVQRGELSLEPFFEITRGCSSLLRQALGHLQRILASSSDLGGQCRNILLPTFQVPQDARRLLATPHRRLHTAAVFLCQFPHQVEPFLNRFQAVSVEFEAVAVLTQPLGKIRQFCVCLLEAIAIARSFGIPPAHLLPPRPASTP